MESKDYIHVVRNDNYYVGKAETMFEAKLLAQDDADDFKIRQVLAKGFAKLFLKKLVTLEHPRYTFLKAISTEVLTNEVF